MCYTPHQFSIDVFNLTYLFFDLYTKIIDFSIINFIYYMKVAFNTNTHKKLDINYFIFLAIREQQL